MLVRIYKLGESISNDSVSSSKENRNGLFYDERQETVNDIREANYQYLVLCGHNMSHDINDGLGCASAFEACYTRSFTHTAPGTFGRF
jgi:hypothetical protein